MIDVWINNGSGWMIELIEFQYINISTYRPLSESFYTDLRVELKSLRKGFYGTMLDILILQKNIQKELLNNLIMTELSFLYKKKDFNKIEVKNNICINVFGYENELNFPIYISDQKFKDSKDLLLLIDNDKLHYAYIKDFGRFMFHKTWFCKSFLQCFSRENVLMKHKENSLSLNGKQSVKLEKGIIKFEFCFKQIPVPFKIHADFECYSKSVKCNEGSFTEKYQDHIPCSFAYKLLVLMIVLLSQLLFVEAKMQLMNLLKPFLRNINIAKK